MKIDTAEFILSATRRDQFLRDDLPEIAFVGRSNVGKSSLMNRLLQRKGLARTSRSPGRTRAVNYFRINRRFYFVDLPGYGFAKVPRAERQRWAELIEQYFHRARGRRLLVQLVDAKVGATRLDQQAFEYFDSLDLEPLLAATKIDKVPRSRRARNLGAIRRTLALPEALELTAVSATSGEGVRQLWNRIASFLRTDQPVPLQVAVAGVAEN
ncbi:MAG: YihA family ribosome biogenesis GTP-binding protein [bacterium]|nr:YihA family ribosome biogenesis GTP-binding protein [bacterium]